MDATLTDNGIQDQTELYEELEVPPEQQYIPAIHIHFNDDLTSKWLFDSFPYDRNIRRSKIYFFNQ